jgi:HlyD family secretion protein
MKRVAASRGWLWPAAAAIAAIVMLGPTLLLLRRPATARAAPLGDVAASGEGVVCFGTVDLEHGISSLLALQPGRVSEVLVQENQAVPEGTDLIRLDDKAARSRLAEAEAGLELSRLRLKQARKLPDRKRSRIAEQEGILEATSTRLEAARQVPANRQKLGQPALVTAVEVTAGELAIRELEAQERVEAQRLAELKAEDVDSEIQQAEYDLAVAEARRDQARLGLEECRVKAPRAGTVLRILVGPGDVLGADRAQPAVLFAIDGPQVIRASVEQEFASRIKEGESARIEDEADRTVSLRGKVTRLAAWYSQRRIVMHDPSQMSDVRTLECVLVLEPGQPRLRLGQSVRVAIGQVPPSK